MRLLPTPKPIQYPDSDGNPIAENTLQFDWIVTIKENLEALFAKNEDVFVAGDLLWYPVEGHPEIRQAPDALVAFGRPKGRRGSYQQWREGGVAPQVVFEVLSPGNRPAEMTRKFKFYEHHGVDEYYIYDPDDNELTGWIRKEGELQEIPEVKGWTSPRLGIRFDWSPERLVIRNPDGSPFLTVAELVEQRDALAQENRRKERDLELATWEKEKERSEKEKERSEKVQALRDKEMAESLLQQRDAELAELRARLRAFEIK